MQLSIFKTKIDNCKHIQVEGKNKACLDKFELKLPTEYNLVFQDKLVKINQKDAETQYSSYAIRLESGEVDTPDINYMYINGHWMWKSTVSGLGCSCRYYPVNLRDPSIECSFDGIFKTLSSWFKSVNSKLVSVETSYEGGLKVLIEALKDSPGTFSSPDLVIAKDPDVVLSAEECSAIDCVAKLKQEATRNVPGTISLFEKDLGVNVCKLSSINPIQESNDPVILSGDVWLELAAMGDGSICYVQYTEQEVMDFARKGLLNKIGEQINQNI
jgi:hypothetical protein